MEESIEKIENTRQRGGKREGSGRKLNVDRLIQESVVKELKIREAQFWVDLAEKHAIPRLMEILQSPLGTISDKTLLTATREVLDRALGKPKESIDHTTNGKDIPTPILPIAHVHSHNRDKEGDGPHEADTSATGGNVVQQDSIDALIPDSESANG